MDSQPQLRTKDLLNEQMSDAEVRTLLERLGSKEFGGSESATVGAVVEATGADLATVGRLLAEIRKEDFENRFGLQLKDHGRRIETLEHGAREERFKPPVIYREPLLDPYQQRALDHLASEERQREVMRPITFVIGAASLLFLVLAAGGVCDSKKQRQDSFRIETSRESSGFSIPIQGSQ